MVTDRFDGGAASIEQARRPAHTEAPVGVPVSGRTEIIAHVGIPTESFMAPLIYNPWFSSRGIDALVTPMGVETEDFDAFFPLLMRLRNMRGALITMPYKTRVTALVDQPTTAVQVCGACNAVRRDPEGRLVGDIFDGTGLLRAVLATGRTVRGADVAIVGSGGVGAAIAASFAKAGVGRLQLSDIDNKRVSSLVERLMRHYPALSVSVGAGDMAQASIVVNATPVGMHPTDPLPFDVNRLAAGSLVCDVVLSRRETAVHEAAYRRGHQVVTGQDMLFEQIPAYLDFFGFEVPDVAQLRAVAIT